MSSNQQFCLRWNNHQSTLISVFDHLLESGTLVDCTLAAEGQFLKAHKVVLSACSPYLEALLSQHYEKHPILILKDVSFHELKSMLDYMYRGEVNISQEQLGTFLKAAESLQIKGLTDCGALSESREIERPREMELGRIPGEFNRNDRSLSSVFPKRIDIRKQIPIQPRPRSPLVGLPANFVMNTDHRKVNKQPLPLDGNLGISNAIRNREGSLSPTVKRKKPNSFGSQNEDPSVPPAIENNIDQNHFHQQKSEQIQNSSPVSQNLSNSVPVSTNMSETKKLLESENSVDSEVIKREVKMENVEFTDEVQNEDSVEDLTVDEEEEEMDEMDLSQPGPSTASNSLVAGVPWHSAGEGNGDDGLLASQHDSQDERRDKLTPLKSTKHRVGVSCGDCGSRSWSNGLVVHKDSCPKMDKSKMYQCQCGDIFSNKRALTIHRVACSGPSFVSLTRKTYKCSKCIKSFRSKKTLNLHVESCTFVPGRSLVVVCKCGKECKSAQGLSMHQRRCEIVDYSGQLRDFSKPLHEEAERKSPKTDSRRRTPSLREGFDVEKEKPVDFKPVSEKGESGLAKTVRNTESSPGRESNKSEVKEQVSSDSKNNSASASEIIKEIAEDFHSEPSTPTKEDELMNAVALRDADNMNDDEEEYCRHLPLSPVSSLKDTPVKTSVQLEKSPEKEPMKSDSSRSSTSPTPKKKIKRSSKKHLNTSPVNERIQKKNCSDSKTNQFGKPQKFLCKCGKAFKTKDAYKKHKTVLCTLKMMRCNWCLYQTRDTNSMRNHVVNTHRDLLLNACSDSSSE